MTQIHGHCHCGRVRVHIPEQSVGVVACHCDDCQKLHGNFFAMLVAEQAQVVIEGEEHVRWYASSEAVERGFCGVCGSRIAKRPLQSAKIMLAVGLFDRALPKTLIKNIWVEQQPAWYTTPPIPGEVRHDP